ncbi:GHKL domain-containing protein [Sulfurimonas aquatica]|uniref:GHKL domain-containing protein n=1 Tax=Sulfurimonas aquatica TaxID=2672570 RepID=A0A975GCZ3_9BACT|nr:sensor histidine kinase [Sulfurimonas aquatica]QSZ42140.1 GHKL domain-containing protein [Sulfurimonas aquatica]
MNKIVLILLIFISSLFGESNLDIKTSYYLTKDDLTLAQIKQVKNFIPSKGDNFGLLKQNCWLKLELKNHLDEIQTRVFKFRFAYMDDITLYEDGKTPQKYGRTNNYNKQINSIDNNIFKITLTPFEKKVVFIKISSSYTIKTFLQDSSQEEHLSTIFFHKMLFSFSYGILFALILYNFFVWYSIKIKVYLYYVLFHFVFLLGIISWTGFGFEFIWPNYPLFNYYSYGILGNLLYGFHILFIITYLNAEAYLPKTTSFLKSIAYLFFFFSLTSLLYQGTLLYELLSIFSMVLTLVLILYIFFIKKVQLALYILISNIIIIIGSIFMVLSDMGLTNGSLIMDYFFVWGACVEVILMSFALAYKYKDLEDEKESEKLIRIQTQEMLISKHKLSTLGQMMNNLVHQWRQPLSQINSIVLNIEDDFFNKKLDEVRLNDKLNDIEATTTYLSQTLNDFRNFSINEKNQSKFLIKPLIEEVLSIINFTININDIEIDVSYSSSDIYIVSNKNELLQILMVILSNAKDALIENKTKNPKIKIEVIQEQESITIEISNNAGAIPDEIINEIFEPYFSTKKFEDGTGLGLHIATLIADKLDISISVKTLKEWTLFSIKI